MAAELARSRRSPAELARAVGDALAPAPKKHAKKAAKHVSEKHAGHKHAAKKHAAHKAPAKKHAKKAAKHVAKDTSEPVVSGRVLPWSQPDRQSDDAALFQAFHHMQRAGAVISLLEPNSGGDLKALLEHGIDLYRSTADKARRGSKVQCAAGLLRAAEHLGMAGLYTARREHRVDAPTPSREEIAHHLDTLDERLDEVSPEERGQGERLKSIARELLRQAEASGDDPHLEYELTMAADGICSALEAGL